ncbi:MAG: hypothetical protein FJY54_08785 [Betaproteobacteria bacterium]|nr:hypothetical protein [Betaproteobacteria bacterium]
MRARLILPVLFLASVLFGMGASMAQSLSAQSSSAAGVTIKATPRALSGGAWEFEIVFDTHTQELKDDLMKSASLASDGRSLAPAAWKGDPPGGHHRKGVLRFDAADPQSKTIELTITRPGEPKPRSFRWQLK